MRCKQLLLLMLIALVGGCSTLSLEECRGQDWYALGYSDASLGLSTKQFLEYQNGCAFHGVTPLRGRYLAGWSQGQNRNQTDTASAL